MIAVIFDVFLLQANTRIVIVIKDSLARFQHWYTLPVDTRRVEQKGRTSGPYQFDDLRTSDILYLIVADGPRMLLPVTALDVIKVAATDVGEIESQLYLAGDLARVRLVVPGISVPAMKISLRGQRLPALRFGQLVPVAEI